LPGAVDYETVLAQSSGQRPALDWSPDDLYILYTRGTTGMPKGVLWRQADILVAALGGRAADGRILETLDAYVERATTVSMKTFPAAPYMHGAGHGIALSGLHQGNTVFIQSEVERLDPADILSLIEREEINFLQIVGDAFARPIVDAIRSGSDNLSSLGIILSGGAPLNASIKAEILDLLPNVMIIDGLGSSEAGGQGLQTSNKQKGREQAQVRTGSRQRRRRRGDDDGAAAWPRRHGVGGRNAATCRLDTSTTQQRRSVRSSRLPVSSLRCPAIAHGTWPTAPSNCTGAIP
jgi:acyl-CoA synthetase (AMP-forming)/AMP-acid ligase II